MSPKQHFFFLLWSLFWFLALSFHSGFAYQTVLSTSYKIFNSCWSQGFWGDSIAEGNADLGLILGRAFLSRLICHWPLEEVRTWPHNTEQTFAGSRNVYQAGGIVKGLENWASFENIIDGILFKYCCYVALKKKMLS